MTNRAKKPKTEITAIAQSGKFEVSLLFCTLPVGLVVEEELEFDGTAEDADELEVIVESM